MTAPAATQTPEFIVSEEPGSAILAFNRVMHDPVNFRLDWTSPSAVADLEGLAHDFETVGFKKRFAPAVYWDAALGMFVVKDGNRRFGAMLLLLHENRPIKGYPLGYGPFTIIEGSTQDLRIEGLIANTKRRDLNAMEEAYGYTDVLLNGVPFNSEDTLIYATITADELAFVITMAGEFSADIKPKLKVQTEWRDYRLPRLTLFDIVEQTMRTCSSLTKIDAFVKRLALMNLIDDVRSLVAKGSMTIDFANALCPLDRNHQYKALENWMASQGKMRLETFQAMCVELARAQIAGAQASMFDDDFWKIVAVDEITDEGRKRKGKKRGLKVNTTIMKALDDMDITRSLANQDTAIEMMVQGLIAQGHEDAALIINALREKLHAGYWAKPADTAQAMAQMAKTEERSEKKRRKAS